MKDPLGLAIYAPEAGAHRHSIVADPKDDSKGKCQTCQRPFWRDQRRRWFPRKDER